MRFAAAMGQALVGLSTSIVCLLAACHGDRPDREGGDLTVALPETAAAAEDLVARATGARGAVTWSWTVDGAATPWDGDTVPAAGIRIGERWEVTAVDGAHEATATTEVSRLGGNVLVILADDLGIDKVGVYGEHDLAPPTPRIDALAADGVLFRNAWVQPTCSPTRASLLTGRYPRRHGVGRWILPSDQRMGIDPAEVILPEMLAAAPVHYDDALVGKWHLTGYIGNPDPGNDPVIAGFSWFAGTLGNPEDSFLPSGPTPKGYVWWEKAVNGELGFVSDYLTTVTTDDALERMDRMAEPWLLYVAYNAPHSPLHIPPAHLQSSGLAPGDDATDKQKYDAMVEALDTEVGRLLDTMDPEVKARTTIVFLSDNGTPRNVIRAPLDHNRSKGTVYEGGVNVPMIVTGPAVGQPGTESYALVESVDLLHTVAEIAGVDLGDVIDPRTGAPVRTDGISFLPYVRDPDLPSVRTVAYTSKHYTNGGPPYELEQDVVRDNRYKLAYHAQLGYWFFEYVDPFDEGPELLALGPLTAEQQSAYDRLETELWDRIDALPFGP